MEILELREETPEAQIFEDNRTKDNLALWSIEHRTIRGEPFLFEGHEYLVQICQDGHKNKVIQKASQIGISEYFVNESFWLAEQGYNSLVIFPAGTQLNDFSHARVDRAIEESGYLSSKIEGINNVGLKRFGNSYIYYRGSQETRQVKTIDADALYLDELDEINPAMIPLAEKRLGHSKLKWIRATSTPTFPEIGINKLYGQSDMCEWYVKCDFCNERQALDFFENMVKESGRVLCKKCHNPLDRLSKGEWVARRPSMKNLRGYLVPKLACIRTDLQELIDNSKKTAAEDVQAFYNADLGLTYVPKDGAIPTELLDDLRGDYIMPEVGNKCIMGIDVGTWLNIWIIEPTADGRRKTVGIKAVVDFEDLDRLMARYNIVTVVVDAMPETRKAIEFCKKYPNKAWYCRYTESDAKDGTYGHFKADEVTREITANRTLAGDYFVDGLNTRNIILPSNVREINNFYDQVQASIRVIKKDAKGIARAFYINSKPDHYFHAGVYMDLAFKIWVANNGLQTSTSRITNEIELGAGTRGSTGISELLGDDREYLRPLEE